MARCPKCESRKGKRRCPALGAEICARCCGEHRLRTIPCPRDCPFLEGEGYQQGKRRERAWSTGREFVGEMKRLFPADRPFDFAMTLQMDIHRFFLQQGTIDNGAVALALEELRGLLSRIYVPQGQPHPLALHLRAGIERAGRYRQEPAFTDREAVEVVERLIRFVRSLGDSGACSFADRIATFFGSLDLQKDFGGAGDETDAGDGEGLPSPFRRSRGGLILPS